MSEALALKRALMLSVDLGHDIICFETDSQWLVNCIKDGKPDFFDWRCRGIIQDIINLMASNVGFSVTYIPRDGNAAADCIAAEASKGVYPLGWVSQLSPLLLSILTEDARSIDDISEEPTSSLRSGIG